jgi:hypothetical protein
METEKDNVDPYADSPYSVRYDLKRFTDWFKQYAPNTLSFQ